MGYDLEIITNKTKRKYHMWFSVWEWYRLLVVTLHGLGALTSEEVERKLMTVNELQAGTLPNDEEIEGRIDLSYEKDDDDGTIQNEILSMDLDTDVQGRIIGIGVGVPMHFVENADESEIERLHNNLESLCRIQMMTNHMLFDTQDMTGFGNKTCRGLACNDGFKLSSDTIAALGCGMFIAASKGGIIDENLTEFLQNTEFTETFQNVLKELKEMDSGDFEIEELWENHKEEIPKWFAIMIKATSLDAKIKIT